jgi:hypothetical protein
MTKTAVTKTTQSLLTRYRPKTFDEMIGQADAIAAFKNAVATGSRVFLFHSGTVGVGKTTMARLGVEYVGAQQVIEIDGAKCNGVEDMRELSEYNFLLADSRANIVDEVQRITAPGWTVLLKPLEEPPAGLYWFLCTTELARVPPNIRSRCAVIHLSDVGRDVLVDHLRKVCRKERWKTPTDVLALCAQQAMGSVRFALSFLAICSGCTTREEAARLIGSPLGKELFEDQPGYLLARALTVPKWSEIQLLLERIKGSGEHAESVRQVVRAYYATITATGTDERRVCYALKVLDHFSEPVSDFPALVLAVGRVVFGEENRNPSNLKESFEIEKMVA